MKRKYYDDYDYEEAYQKQCDTLEEWELERLMKEGNPGSHKERGSRGQGSACRKVGQWSRQKETPGSGRV